MAIYTTPTPGAFGPNGYANAANTAKLAYDQSVAQIGQKRSGLLRQYGYQAKFDPTTGSMSGLSVDAGNPFGQFQQMLRGDANQSQQDEYAMQDRGLHGGLANQAQTADKYQHGLNSAALGQNLLGGINDLQNAFTQSGTDYNNALAMAEWQAAQQAIQDQQFNAADYSGLDEIPYDYREDLGGAPSGAAEVPNNITRQVGQSYYVSPSKAGAVSKASAAALKNTSGSAATKALAARSAGLNAAYNIPTAAPKAAAKPAAKPTVQATVAKKVANAYTSGQKKRG